MEECGILEELLPQLGTYLEKARKGTRDGDRVFWDYLDALDYMRAKREELGNPLLLGALAVHLLGVVPGQPGMEQRPPAELAQEVETLTRDWVKRIGVARRDRERLAYMLRSQPRFLRPRGRRFRPRSFVTKHYYPDSEALFALGCRATGLELETLARWQSIAEGEGPPASAPANSGTEGARPRTGRGRRRRRRRR